MPTPTPLTPKLQEHLDGIAAVVTEANDAVTLAKSDLERVNMDVRAAQGRLEQTNADADKAKRTLVAVTQRIDERTKGYKDTLAKHAREVEDAEAKAKEANLALLKVLKSLSGAKHALSEAIKQKAAVAADFEALSKKIAEGNTQLGVINTEIGTKTATQTALDKDVRKLESTKNTLIAEIETLETKKSDAQTAKDNELATVEATIKARRAELAKVEKKIEQFNNYIETETKVLEAKQRLIEREQTDVNQQKRKVQSDRSILSPLS